MSRANRTSANAYDVRQPELTVVGATTYLHDVAWLSKLHGLLQERGLSYEYWCWNKTGQNAPRTTHYARRILLSTPADWPRAPLYPLWMLAVMLAGLLRREPPRRFLAVSFDTAFPLALVSYIRPTSFIFANRDNLWMSHRFGPLLTAILKKCEAIARTRSALHIIPSEARLDKKADNDRILPSSPLASHVRAAARFARERGYKRGDKLTVYVNGWLVPTRGLSTIYEAIAHLDSSKVDVLMAGKDYCSHARQLATLPNVTDLGRLAPEESLAHYHRSHVVITFYDPALRINQLAEPNKWRDCVATGTPFITNTEVRTARPFIEADACFHVPYSDAVALAELLDELAANRERWTRVRRNLTSSFHAPPWDTQMSGILDEFLGRGAIRS